MSRTIKLLLALVAAALMAFAVAGVIAGQYVAAGMSLLIASFVIFVRETRV